MDTIFKYGISTKNSYANILLFFVLAAILSVYSGLILDAVLQKEKREFEFRLQLINNGEISEENRN